MFNLDVYECKKPEKEFNLPFFTDRMWLLLLAMGALGGVVGGWIYDIIMAGILGK